jgi:hypothetical protein
VNATDCSGALSAPKFGSQRLNRLDLVFVQSPTSSSQFAGKSVATPAEDWPYLGEIFALEYGWKK